MRKLCLLLLVACKQPNGDDFTVTPGDDDPHPRPSDAGPIGTPEAAVDADPNVIAGRVCVLTDFRKQTLCKDTGVANLRVTLDGATTLTFADGTFVIHRPSATAPVWHVTGAVMGALLKPSVMPYGGSNQIPAIVADAYDELQSDNGTSLQTPNQGEVFIRVLHGAGPVANAFGGSAPQAEYGVFYEGPTADTWIPDAAEGTGVNGVIWLPAVAIGPATLSITSNGTLTPLANVPVESQAITFVTIDVP